MPLLYQDTTATMKRLRVTKFSPDASGILVGLIVGFIVGIAFVPIILPITGYQLTKRFGPPQPSR